MEYFKVFIIMNLLLFHSALRRKLKKSNPEQYKINIYKQIGGENTSNDCFIDTLDFSFFGLYSEKKNTYSSNNCYNNTVFFTCKFIKESTTLLLESSNIQKIIIENSNDFEIKYDFKSVQNITNLK